MKSYFPSLFISVNKKYIFFISGLYLFFLVINLPANMVVSFIKIPGNIKISSTSGTIWSGSISKLKISGINLGSVNWELHPLNLLIGELSVDVSIVNRKQYFKSEVSFSTSGKIEFEETNFKFNLSSLQPLTYGMPFSYAGDISGYFPLSFFHKNNYVGVNGKLSLSNMVMISPQQQSFGDFFIDFRAEKEGATSGRIKDSGGELSLDGQLSMSKNGQFKISAKLAAREKNSSLEKVILFLGRKDASGRVLLNSNFKLWH
ncbi:MAG: type II secretion system protein N [Gammaproteobacteria bacterium]|nr:type II secretion system protein N [Gammaproteobacteria bacterium]